MKNRNIARRIHALTLIFFGTIATTDSWADSVTVNCSGTGKGFHTFTAALAKSLSRPSTPKASAVVLRRLLRLLPAGAIIAGWDLHPLEGRAFARRTGNGGYEVQVADLSFANFESPGNDISGNNSALNSG
jgi:hypothetical protein